MRTGMTAIRLLDYPAVKVPQNHGSVQVYSLRSTLYSIDTTSTKRNTPCRNPTKHLDPHQGAPYSARCPSDGLGQILKDAEFYDREDAVRMVFMLHKLGYEPAFDFMPPRVFRPS